MASFDACVLDIGTFILHSGVTRLHLLYSGMTRLHRATLDTLAALVVCVKKKHCICKFAYVTGNTTADHCTATSSS